VIQNNSKRLSIGPEPAYTEMAGTYPDTYTGWFFWVGDGFGK